MIIQTQLLRPMETNISLAKLTITDLARELEKVLWADPFKAVYWKGKMISPTLASSFLRY